MKKLHIDIYSDVVCPWCYLGKRRLELALEELSGEVSAVIEWKPFQLEPSTPPEGFDTFRYLADKLGGGMEQVKRSHQMLTSLGAEIGLPFALEKATRFPNTMDAHRLILWAGQESKAIQEKVAAALFTANFVEGRDVGDHKVLADIAEGAGMDRVVVERLLAGEADRDTIKAEIESAQRMGISGVPLYVVEGKYAISGAQGVEVFTNALKQIAGMKAAV
jgi:predicted DsbA family dithiol-disulfide isomerase